MTPKTRPLEEIRGLLLDVGGVLYQGSEALPGAVEAVRHLRERQMPFRLLTNTTRTTRAGLTKRLAEMGFDVGENDIVTPASIAASVLERDGASAHLLVHPDLLPDCPPEATAPNAVLMGDAGEYFTFERLNRAFRILVDGGRLYALGKNRFFRGEDGFELDAGPFVAALEYAAEVEAELIGKPARDFFTTAAAELDLAPEEVAMVGDDLESDIEGALAAGLQAVLVRTGKYRDGDGSKAKRGGAHVAASLAEFVDELLA
ncbi:HAD-superfamily subfamily IIA hydrolase like protein [Parvibaculum lavamentivorans DS-1]|uniref:Haloacid dehalogenase-like hydrolase domain-containing protein 2 n=1 Tax=Parvibaculum lavamentivorans (strain DS-1 / DSM 13023 / NCIMB 13966) TaxID=402881 RepID=A7HTQ2_PARL1|nr:TIGR01458 family HAD-type hydrolase [Parvibaculum lavamentivorans]ABS63285.1 HAD-superfamily subfamily IIA hydrolase like protein [Parvibaculum lavamentivorans DS-1]